MKTKKQKENKVCDAIEFTEGVIKVLHAKASKNNVDPKLKMKFLAQVCRRVLHHFDEINEEFVPVALLVEKVDKISIMSKDKTKKEIEVNGLPEFISLFPALAPPKVIHASEIDKIEKMLEKNDNEDVKK